MSITQIVTDLTPAEIGVQRPPLLEKGSSANPSRHQWNQSQEIVPSVHESRLIDANLFSLFPRILERGHPGASFLPVAGQGLKRVSKATATELHREPNK